MSSNKSQLKSGLILNYINIILGTLIPIFYTPVMLNILGQNEYGLYKLSSGVTSYLSLMSLGIGSAVTRYLIKANIEKGKEEEERVLGLFMIIFKVIAVLTFIIGMILTFNLEVFYGESLSVNEISRMKILVFLMVCQVTLSFLVSPYMAIVNAHEKFVFLQICNIITTSVVPIANLVALFMGFASIGMAVSSLSLSLIINIVYLTYVRKSIRIKAKFRNMPTYLIKEILIFSFWIFLSNVVNQLYNMTDTILIGAIPSLATAGVAVYNVGTVFNNIVFQATTGISTLFAPKSQKLVFLGATSTQLTDLAIRLGRIQCYIITLIVTGFIAFGKPFINLYAGAGYEDSYWVAILMMIPNTISLVQSVCLNIVVAENKHRFRSIVYLFIAIINVVGSWYMMKIMGVIGAALVTGIALIIGPGLLMNWYYWKKIKLEIGRFWKELSPIMIVPLIMCILTLLLSKMIDFYCLPIMFIGIVSYTLIYCLMQWKLNFNNFEKSLILSPIKKVYNKLFNK